MLVQQSQPESLECIVPLKYGAHFLEASLILRSDRPNPMDPRLLADRDTPPPRWIDLHATITTNQPPQYKVGDLDIQTYERPAFKPLAPNTRTRVSWMWKLPASRPHGATPSADWSRLGGTSARARTSVTPHNHSKYDEPPQAHRNS